ncbi:unnamed protein product [Linum trigynum]|uniref:F-box/LRR-repeat protein 15/At3g58940/PEG3-like LRR domain-containing protein n=1 Tax=Linum trigynum TaxID=586398 RepID=A0AAV2GFF4_9ROSI
MNPICESSSSNDRISNLPAYLAERILMLLPLKEAAKTATWSRQWRYRWRNLPQLVFDADFARTRWAETASNVNALVMKIYKAVLLHNYEPSTKFVLAVPGLKPGDEIDHLILYLANKGIQDITLRILDEFDRFDYVYETRNFASLFAALELNTLKLENCELLSPSGFLGFSKLTCLELVNVIVDEDFFVGFLRKCPLLEELRMIDCLGFRDSPDIEAPRLKVLCLRIILWTIRFKYTPVLSLVSIQDYPDYLSNRMYSFQQDSINIVDVFVSSIPALQQLRIGIEFLRLLAAGNHVPKRLPTPLQHLEVLEMDNLVLHSLPEARVLVCLIMSSPNLKTLTIQIDDGERIPQENVIDSLRSLLEAKDLQGSGGCFQSLEEFSLNGIHGSQVELDLVNLVLASAPLLHEIVITTSKTMNFDESHKFMTGVSYCKWGSKKAKLLYSWNGEYENIEDGFPKLLVTA